jgi:alkylhydroperoxidase/carboxymuconolactone decarboxylase family protein YurZ
MADGLLLSPRQLCEMSGLAPDTRLLVCMLAALARPDLEVLREAISEAHRRDLDPPRMREAILMGVLFAGFPRAISAFEILLEHQPAADPLAEATASGPGTDPAAAGARGEKLFGMVYGEHSAAVQDRLRQYHPIFHRLVIQVAYGTVLPRPVLDVETRELMAVGALCVLDQTRELISHARGARNVGVPRAEVEEAVRTVTMLWSDLDQDRLLRTVRRAI